MRSPPNPKDRFARLLARADAANAARHWAAAETGYADALRLDPLRADIWVQYGHALKEQGKLDQAVDAYRAGSALDPPTADAHQELGHLLKRLGRVPEAIEALLAALAIDPSATAIRADIEGLGGTPPAMAATHRASAETAPFRDLDDLPVRTAQAAPHLTPAGSRAQVPVRSQAGPSPRTSHSLAFIHLHKTGGLTLHDVLERNFAADRVCPVKDDHLHLYSGDELAGFDFFSGHFDYGALRLLGRPPVRVVSWFRRPRDRLISFYRFHAGHDLGARHGVNAFVRMANAMTVEEFFEDDRVRRAPEVFNHYLVAFGLSYHQVLQARTVTVDRIDPATVDRAVDRVRGLDAIGITERFDDSVALACRDLGFAPPGSIRTRNETDALSAKMKGEPPPRVTVTPRLADAMQDLVRFDDPIYAVALAEFERRLGKLRP